MWQAFLEKIRLIAGDRSIRNRILFVLGMLVLFRLGAALPMPGVDHTALAQFFSSNQFFGLLNVFSGSGLSNLSLFMLGVGPYITATIIMQLLTMIFPRLKEIYQEEGEAGRRKFAQYSRLLTVPLALLQGFSLLSLLSNQGVLGNMTLFEQITNTIVVTAGSILVMWIGELISEYGIGNGVSLIIFSGIVATLPLNIARALFTLDVSQVPLLIGLLVAALLIIAGVVFVTEAERPIPVTYAKRVRGMKMYGGISTYLPLRVNQAGVIPIIFALSILLFPQMIANFLGGIDNTYIQAISDFLETVLQNMWVYGTVYFLLVFVFTYFYTAVTFDPDAISENLQKNGAFIPGTRPGKSTSEHIGRVLTRLTTFGALFLAIIAVLPIIVQGITGIASLAIGGTALLIVVSVVLDLTKQINAQVTMREY